MAKLSKYPSIRFQLEGREEGYKHTLVHIRLVL